MSISLTVLSLLALVLLYLCYRQVRAGIWNWDGHWGKARKATFFLTVSLSVMTSCITLLLVYTLLSMTWPQS